MNDESESKVEPTVVSILTNSLFDQCSSPRKLRAATWRKIGNFPDDIRVSNAGDDAGFIRQVSLGQYFVTTHDTQLVGLGCAGSCREYTSPRDDKRSKPKGWIRGNTKIGPVSEVKVANDLKRCGIEVKSILDCDQQRY